MATPARVDRRGHRRAQASPSHHPGGDRVGNGRARSGRAVPRRPPRCRPRLARRSRPRRQPARARVRYREPRGVQKDTKRVRRTNRRLRGLLAGVAVLLVAAVAGGVFAAIQRSEARHAETAQFVQRLGAQALVEDDLDLSLLLARQAVAIDDSPQTRGYLLATRPPSRPAAIGICTVTATCSGKSPSVPTARRWRCCLAAGRRGFSSSTREPTRRSGTRCRERPPQPCV